MNKGVIKALVEGVVCSALSLVLVLIGVFVPHMALLMTILAGIPMMYLGMRRGIRVLVVFFLVAELLLLAITGNPVDSLLIGMMSFLPGIVVGRSLRKGLTFQGIIFSGAGMILFGLLVQLVLLNAMGDGHGIETLVNQSLDGVRQSMNDVFVAMEGQFAGQGQEIQVAVNQGIDLMRDMIFLYLPSFLIGFSVVISYLLFMLGIFFLHRLRPVRIIYQPFWGFCVPRSMCYLGALLFLITSLSTDTTVWTAALRNIEVLLYAYFGVCGISFLDYKLRKKISSGYARCAVYLMALCVGYLFLGMLFQGLCILGMIDGMFGFRIREEFGHE